MADLRKTNLALEGEKALLVVLNGGDEGLDPEIEQAVAAAVQAGKPVRVLVGEITRVPAFFKQVDDLIVRYFRPDDVASFQRALDELCFAHRGYPAVVCWGPEEVAEEWFLRELIFKIPLPRKLISFLWERHLAAILSWLEATRTKNKLPCRYSGSEPHYPLTTL